MTSVNIQNAGLAEVNTLPLLSGYTFFYETTLYIVGTVMRLAVSVCSSVCLSACLSVCANDLSVCRVV